MTSFKVILAGDDTVFNNGMERVLKKHVANAVSIRMSGIEKIRKHLSTGHPDFIFLELKVPMMESIALAREVRKINKEIKIVVVSQITQKSIIQMLFREGINGYFVKNTDWSKLSDILNYMYSGHLYISPEIHWPVHDHIHSDKKNDPAVSHVSNFSKAEKRILRLMLQQEQPEEIAAKTGMAPEQVEKTSAEIMAKARATNLIGLALYALQNGIVHPGSSGNET